MAPDLGLLHLIALPQLPGAFSWARHASGTWSRSLPLLMRARASNSGPPCTLPETCPRCHYGAVAAPTGSRRRQLSLARGQTQARYAATARTGSNPCGQATCLGVVPEVHRRLLGREGDFKKEKGAFTGWIWKNHTLLVCPRHLTLKRSKELFWREDRGRYCRCPMAGHVMIWHLGSVWVHDSLCILHANLVRLGLERSPAW